jgi:molybdenum cofactor cytidylyltransferase
LAVPGSAPGGVTVAALAGVVLAAGGGRRFGGPKQLASLGGVSLIRRAAALALEHCPRGVVVVTGAAAGEVAAEVADAGVRTAHNPAWREGLAGSLRVGIDALPAGEVACLVLLADQVLVDRDDLRRLIAAWSAAPQLVAASAYAGAVGVPAIFPVAYRARLRQLSGDGGARALIASLPEISRVAMPHATCDIDTPADLAALDGGRR